MDDRIFKMTSEQKANARGRMKGREQENKGSDEDYMDELLEAMERLAKGAAKYDEYKS